MPGRRARRVQGWMASSKKIRLLLKRALLQKIIPPLGGMQYDSIFRKGAYVIVAN
jgi:hypothetical protein